jgi:uncharacterized protein YbjT (DUF2867 family)
MRILLTGANGFIGAHLTTALLATGHHVVGAVRKPASFQRRFPQAEAIAIDLNRDITIEAWLPRLAGIDAVINCAGILQSEIGQSATAIHYLAPKALFDACARLGIRRVIQISAISADAGAGTAYAATKLLADTHLRSLDLDWIVLRPSLVYAEGSYGGTSLLRALAAMPGFTPLVGYGRQAFQPLHVEDLAQTVLQCLALPGKQVLEPVGPETLTMQEIVMKLRSWLGYRPAPILYLPKSIVALACRVGDLLQAGPFRTTALKQIDYGNTGDAEAFNQAIGFTPRRLDEALAAHPAQTQDCWHARLYLLRPLITLALLLTWFGSGLVGLISNRGVTHSILAKLGIDPGWARLVQDTTSWLDIAVGALILLGRSRLRLGQLQLAIVLGYTMVLTIAEPNLWLNPFGSLLKNLPILALIMVWMIIGEER